MPMTTEAGAKTLRDFAARCRKLALTARTEASRKELLELAAEMDKEADAWDRRPVEKGPP
jgi:hypothetical protein